MSAPIPETINSTNKPLEIASSLWTIFPNARVDDLGAVQAAELTQLMNRATPEQLAAHGAQIQRCAYRRANIRRNGSIFSGLDGSSTRKLRWVGHSNLMMSALRKLAATAVVNSTSPSAAPELIAMLTEHPDKDLVSECKNGFLDPLIASWSSLDPEAASRFVDALGDTKSSLNSTARENIAYNWGTLDPSSALEWVQKQGDKDYINRNSLYDTVVRGWCRANLPDASAYVRQHLDDPNAPTAASSVAEAMFKHDPDDATSWVGRLPDGNSRKEAESTIARIWSDKDPAAASRWMGALSEKEQGNVVGEIVSNWADTNWSDASRWIDTLIGDVHDSALSVAMNRQDSSESDSLALALKIGNDETRQSRIENVIRNWGYNDPDAAEAWVKSNSLPPEQQSQLFSVISEIRNAH